MFKDTLLDHSVQNYIQSYSNVKLRLRIKDQLDVTCYFILLLMYSTCFGN